MVFCFVFHNNLSKTATLIYIVVIYPKNNRKAYKYLNIIQFMAKSTTMLKNELESIKQRNIRVELDKAWETSWIRKIIIAILTYLVIVIFFYFAELPKPFINSIVPALAFLLSTLTLNFFKKIWIRNKK
jgi:hypothetical protein